MAKAGPLINLSSSVICPLPAPPEPLGEPPGEPPGQSVPHDIPHRRQDGYQPPAAAPSPASREETPVAGRCTCRILVRSCHHLPDAADPVVVIHASRTLGGPDQGPYLFEAERFEYPHCHRQPLLLRQLFQKLANRFVEPSLPDRPIQAMKQAGALRAELVVM